MGTFSGDQPTTTRAKKCVLNPGVLDSLGDQISHLARIWVGDALIAALGVMTVKITLAAVIETLSVVLGHPNLKQRQYPLAMDKWLNIIVAEQ